MTANQRRPGFRLPWAPETDETTGDGESATAAEASSPAAANAGSAEAASPAEATSATTEPAEAAVKAEAVTPAVEADAASDAPAAEAAEPSASEPAPATPAPAAAAAAPESDEFMRDLVAAMRRVADEARESGMAELRTRADDQVHKLEADAEKRREDLRSRAETDIAGVGEWAQAEAERIKAEAEQRVVARRAQLDQQLAADQTRTEAETKALRDRVAEYGRELEAYHAQLAEIGDPAAFAAAAKRMPQPPSLSGAAAASATPTTGSAAPAPTGSASTAAEPATPAEADARVEPATGASNGVAASASEIHPAEEEVLAARLAELDAKLPDTPAATATSAATAEAVTTEVVVKGLGSFGAITGFRQSLAGVEGIEGVALSLGQTGEFVFRATHAAGFDVRGAIATLEGDGAKIEDRSEGGLRVTLDRAR